MDYSKLEPAEKFQLLRYTKRTGARLTVHDRWSGYTTKVDGQMAYDLIVNRGEACPDPTASVGFLWRIGMVDAVVAPVLQYGLPSHLVPNLHNPDNLDEAAICGPDKEFRGTIYDEQIVGEFEYYSPRSKTWIPGDTVNTKIESHMTVRVSAKNLWPDWEEKSAEDTLDMLIRTQLPPRSAPTQDLWRMSRRELQEMMSKHRNSKVAPTLEYRAQDTEPTSGLIWHLMSAMTLDSVGYIEVLASACDEGIGVFAHWKRQEDGTWEVSSMNTERGEWEDVIPGEDNIPMEPPAVFFGSSCALQLSEKDAIINKLVEEKDALIAQSAVDPATGVVWHLLGSEYEEGVLSSVIAAAYVDSEAVIARWDLGNTGSWKAFEMSTDVGDWMLTTAEDSQPSFVPPRPPEFKVALMTPL